jgi:DUF4097 and DUF4098 domain-containing protein YvlB
MTRRLALALLCFAVLSAPAAAQQTESFSRKVRLGANGRLTITNLSGEIAVTAGAGDEVSIEAVKRTNGNRSDLSQVQIQVDAVAGRVDVTTNYESARFRGNSGVWVDYTITVPQTTTVDARSVSGMVRISGIRGTARAESISGTVTLANVAKAERAKTVSGGIELTDITDADALNLNSVSGSIRGTNIKARTLTAETVSGALDLNNATCDRLDARSISGRMQFTGPLAKNGQYDLRTHSGAIAVTVPANAGFVFDATSFSGDIRSAFALTVGGDVNQSIGRPRGPRRSAIHATIGDGSAQLQVETFSGSIVLDKR